MDVARSGKPCCLLYTEGTFVKEKNSHAKTAPRIAGSRQTVKKPNLLLWGCMKGPEPLHIQSAAAACTPRGAAQVAASFIIFRPSPKVTGK